MQPHRYLRLSCLVQPCCHGIIGRLIAVQATNARFKDTKLTDTDWTDAILRRDVQKQLCKVAKGTNPVTQVDTLESLMC